MELYKEIRELSDTLEAQLKKQIDSRVLEMDDDDTSHYLIYRVLGIPLAEGKANRPLSEQGAFSIQIRRFIFGDGGAHVFHTSLSRVRRS